MTLTRAVLLSTLLPLFAGCQSLPWSAAEPVRHTERLQGEVALIDGQLRLQTCQGQRELLLMDGETGLTDDVRALSAGSGERLFADLRGTPISLAGADDLLELSRVYRLQREGPGCSQADFKRLILRASGNEPGWSIKVSGQGLLLERPGQPPLALPYLQEQLPGGQTSFSSEADGQQLNLWIAPQRCVDSASGTVSHLHAELRVDGQTLRGCAYYGGARDD